MRSQDHPYERDRIAFLERLVILDTEAEQLFDDFVQLAATICDVPIALLSLVGRDKQWFKASVGVDVTETSREMSFCSHAILRSETMNVPDATKDTRFHDNVLVVGDFHLRFYAGVPVTVDAYPMGTLCVIDRIPRQLTERQLDALRVLGRQISACLDARLDVRRSRELADKLAFAEEHMRLANKRFESLFHNMAAATYTTDNDGTIFEFSRAAEELFGRRAEAVIGLKDIDVLIPSEERPDAIRVRKDVIDGKSIYNRERRVCGPDGRQVWTVFSMHPITNADGGIHGSIAVYFDISDRKKMEADLTRANQHLELIATTDVLTQIHSRRAILDVLARECSSASRGFLSILLLDVDHFKEYNDHYGHPAGDEVLRMVGDLLKNNCRSTDYAGRYGGEEFIVVLPNTNSLDAAKLGEQIRQSIETCEFPHRHVTVSVGTATTTDKTTTSDMLISLADVRLYSAKSAGRNRVVAEPLAA